MITKVTQIKDDYTGEIKTLKMIKDGIISSVPIEPANIDYAEIMEKVELGELTIELADTEGE